MLLKLPGIWYFVMAAQGDNSKLKAIASLSLGALISQQHLRWVGQKLDKLWAFVATVGLVGRPDSQRASGVYTSFPKQKDSRGSKLLLLLIGGVFPDPIDRIGPCVMSS